MLLDVTIGVGEMPLVHAVSGIGVWGFGGAPPAPELDEEPSDAEDEATALEVTPTVVDATLLLAFVLVLVLVLAAVVVAAALEVVPPAPALVESSPSGFSVSAPMHADEPKQRRPPSAALSMALLASKRASSELDMPEK